MPFRLRRVGDAPGLAVLAEAERDAVKARLLCDGLTRFAVRWWTRLSEIGHLLNRKSASSDRNEGTIEQS
jgi:hypothetical protein